MNYRVLTVAREYGSGGGKIARIIADRLGWKLLDRELIEAIACAVKVDSSVVSNYDERVESWLSRVNRNAIRASAAMALGVVIEEKDCFNAKVMTELTRQIIGQAHVDGECVIVGRGAQCILRAKPDVFRVLVYGPFRDRVRRLRARLDPSVNIEERIHEVDAERANYLRQRFGKAWNNPHLYDLMISSDPDEDVTARIILCAMTGQQQAASTAKVSGCATDAAHG